MMLLLMTVALWSKMFTNGGHLVVAVVVNNGPLRSAKELVVLFSICAKAANPEGFIFRSCDVMCASSSHFFDF